MPSLTTTQAPKGLEGIVATTSSICYIDGDQGVLAYRGIDIHELADHSNFEETCYLLWYGKLPTQSELKDFRQQLAEERKLDPGHPRACCAARPGKRCPWTSSAPRSRRWPFMTQKTRRTIMTPICTRRFA